MITILIISIGKMTTPKNRLEKRAELSGSNDVNKLENWAGIYLVLFNKQIYERIVPNTTIKQTKPNVSKSSSGTSFQTGW